MSENWVEAAMPLFRAACELPVDERASFLDDACDGNQELRRHLDAMLAWDDTADVAVDDAAATHPVRAALEQLVEHAESAPAETESLPDAIGGHRIVRLVAHGGMGVVYEAQQEHPRRRVAIKVARAGGATGERARRFELEAQLLARLSHPGIAQIIETGTTGPEDGTRPFFVMEFVEGQSLTSYAKEHLTTAREKLQLMVRVCGAVAFAHGQGVVHRDLKPDNVLIDAAGQPKVLDFGVAKVEAAGGFGAATLRTEAGRVLGTLGYMAPEQLGGKTEGLGPEADVYSLGVMIYQLLSGRLPHDLDGVTLTRALAVVTTTDAPLLGVIRPELRGDIEAVVAKALEKDHRYRYPHAGALQADLQRHLRGEPILARPAGPLRKLTKWARRKPALATAVLGLFLALATAAVVLLVKNDEVRTALADYGRLEDGRLLEQAVAEADALWPTRPELVPRMVAWFGTYGALEKRTAEHRDALKRIRAEAETTADGAIADTSLRWKWDQLARLVEDLEDFAGEDGEHQARERVAGQAARRARAEARHLRYGLLKEMRQRKALAETIRQRTVDDWSDEWSAARQRVRERYQGLALEPQVGLIPLGPDPDSGLEEFLNFETHQGEIPRRDAAGDLPAVTGDTGLVLVLLPGGTFWMGCQSHDPQGANYDPGAIGGANWPVRPRRADDPGIHWVAWEPLYEATVAPFLLSKYEMTQGQWERFVGSNPSGLVRSRWGPVNPNPVNQVSWEECTDVLRRLGLVLPHEQQWEYAARAGTTTAWWPGPHARDLRGSESLFEQAAALHFAAWWPAKAGVQPAPWFEPWKFLFRGGAVPAPVGSYRANAFGLHDVAGNVTEWCANIPGDLPGHSLPLHEASDVSVRMVRGGNFKRGVEEARSAWRFDISLMAASEDLGVRPAMVLQR